MLKVKKNKTKQKNPPTTHNKQTNKQRDGSERQQRCRQKDIILSASFGEPGDGSGACGVVHNELTVRPRTHLPLFTRARQRSDWSSQLFEKVQGGKRGGGVWTAPPLSATTGLPAGHTSATLVGRRARNHNHNNQDNKKKTPTLCSPITRHQGCDTARRTRNGTRAGTHDHTRALYSKQRTTPHTRTPKKKKIKTVPLRRQTNKNKNVIKAQCGILKLIARVETTRGKVGARGVSGQAVVDGGGVEHGREKIQYIQ